MQRRGLGRHHLLPGEPVIDNNLSRRKVDVYIYPEEREAARELETKFNELKKLLTKEKIPAFQVHASRMVSGYSTISRSGVRVTLGDDWEKPGYNETQIRNLDRRTREGSKGKYFWRFPSRIKVQVRGVDTGAFERSEASQAQLREWTATVRRLGESVGLKWRTFENTPGADPYFSL